MKFIVPVCYIIILSGFTFPNFHILGRVEKHATDIIYYKVNLSGVTLDKVIIHNIRKTPNISYIGGVDIYTMSSRLALNNIIIKRKNNNIYELTCRYIDLHQDKSLLAQAKNLTIIDKKISTSTQPLLNIEELSIFKPFSYKGSINTLLSLDTAKHSLILDNLDLNSSIHGRLTGSASFGDVTGFSLFDILATKFKSANVIYKTKQKTTHIFASPSDPVSILSLYLLKDNLTQLLSLLNVKINNS